MTIGRRHFLAGLGAVGIAAALPGCANPDNQPAPVDSPAGGVFPVSVQHRYGTTTVPGAPQRIIALGQTDLDPVAALGFTPVAVGSFTGTDYSPVRPWNQDHFPTEPERLDMMEIAFEKVAALAPDLILCVMSGITKADYAKLSKIAPTVAQPTDFGDWAVPYQPHTELIGRALGKEAEAKKLVADLDQAFADVRAANPTLQGEKSACAERWDADFAVIGETAPRTHFLSDIGMELLPALTALVGKEYNAPLSGEKIDLLDDLDVVVWTTDHQAVDELLGQKIVAGMRTTREGRYVIATDGGDDNLLYSMDWGTILSNRYAIEHAVPRFVKAVDGDPATDANA